MVTPYERTTVVGVFETRAAAERALDALHRAGFEDDQIGILTQGGEEPGGVAPGEGESGAGERAATGAVTGGVVGGLLGAAASLLIPGIGPVLAGGILATTLGGAALGAAAGGLIGGLAGMGVPEEEARYYESEFRSGRTIVTVRANGRSQEASEILRRFGAYDAREPRATAPPAGPEVVTPTTPDVDRGTPGADLGTRPVEGEQTIELREEQLQARKRPVEAGEIEIRKEVVTEYRTIEVPVQREEIIVERRPVEDRPAEGRPVEGVEGRELSDLPVGELADLAEGETIRIPVREEEVIVEKRPVIREEVEVSKRRVTETEQVAGTVQREEVRVEREGDVRLRDTERWEDVLPRYRTSWQQRFGSQGGRWEDYEPGYRYGWEMSNRPEYSGRSWAEIEPELRRDWETRHRDKPWDRAADAVRDAWESVRR